MKITFIFSCSGMFHVPGFIDALSFRQQLIYSTELNSTSETKSETNVVRQSSYSGASLARQSHDVSNRPKNSSSITRRENSYARILKPVSTGSRM